MDAYIYLRIEPGSVNTVLAQLFVKQGVRNAVAVIGDWDILGHIEGPDLATISKTILGQIHYIEGVRNTLTCPVVPPDRVGFAGWGAPQTPGLVRDACYVHIKAAAGAAGGLAERLSDVSDVSGVAVLGGEYDLMACVAQPWEIASGVIIEQIHGLPGVVSTKTLVSVHFEETDEDRDQFSTWN
jgi:DNA-binding Lrp family transcriptional regulator